VIFITASDLTPRERLPTQGHRKFDVVFDLIALPNPHHPIWYLQLPLLHYRNEGKAYAVTMSGLEKALFNLKVSTGLPSFPNLSTGNKA
jgi:hypothetical protein